MFSKFFESNGPTVILILYSKNLAFFILSVQKQSDFFYKKGIFLNEMKLKIGYELFHVNCLEFDKKSRHS